MPTFSHIFARYISSGTEKESQLLCLLIEDGIGLEILRKYSASQVIKSDANLPKSIGKREALDLLKCMGNSQQQAEAFSLDRKMDALQTPSFLRLAQPPLLNEDELIWLNPEDFLIEDKRYMYDTNMCETK